jgi:hypothetical protein
MISQLPHPDIGLDGDFLNFLPGLASNCPLDFCLPSSKDYRIEPPCLALISFLIEKRIIINH